MRSLLTSLFVTFLAFPILAKDAKPAEIKAPPFGKQSHWPFYKPDRYTEIEEYGVEIYATPGVSEWMIENSRLLVYQMIDALKNPADREKFRGHENFLITDKDPDLSVNGARKGHRNTGGNGYSLFNEILVCAEAVDTISPHVKAVYRAWDTPVHEFGHAIEHTLKLANKSDELYSQNVKNYNPAVAREYFAWGTQKWFSCSGSRANRHNMPKWEFDYFSSVFDIDHTWLPVDTDGKQTNIQKWDDSKNLIPMSKSDLSNLEGNYQSKNSQGKVWRAKMKVLKKDLKNGVSLLLWKDHNGDEIEIVPLPEHWVLTTEPDKPVYSFHTKSGKELYIQSERWGQPEILNPQIGIWYQKKFFVKQ